jgi:peptidoglycan/xylan/chitin deacetylase (PgdA/CDA1 family)
VNWSNLKKTLAVNVLDMAGAGFFLRPFLGGRGAVLAFHSVQPEEKPILEFGNVVRAGHLRDILRYATSSGWELISLDNLPERLGRETSGGRFLAITLDDGYRDNLLHALPVFREFQAPFTVFPATGFLSRSVTYWTGVAEELLLQEESIVLENPTGGSTKCACRTWDEKQQVFDRIADCWEQPHIVRSLTAACNAAGLIIADIMQRRFLSWEELRSLSQDPLASVGVHTVSHLGLAGLPADQAAEEMSAAKRELEERLGVAVRHIAYPFGSPGACGEREFRLARELGFATGYTTLRGNLYARHRDSLWSLPRHTLSMARHSSNLRYLRLSLSGVWDTPLPRMVGR